MKLGKAAGTPNLRLIRDESRFLLSAMEWHELLVANRRKLKFTILETGVKVGLDAFLNQ